MRKLLTTFALLLLIPTVCFAGASRDFDGTSDYISISDSASIDRVSDNNALTVACWINNNNNLTGDKAYVSRWGTGTNQFRLWMDDAAGADGYAFVVNRGTSLTAGTTNNDATLDEWTFVAGTWDGTTARVYKDGTETDSSANAGSLAASNTNVDIGQEPVGGKWVYGQIAYVHLYSRALSVAEITQIMYNPGSIVEDLEAYLPLWGNTDPEPDLTGNGNTGANTGSTESFIGPPVFFSGGGK